MFGFFKKKKPKTIKVEPNVLEYAYNLHKNTIKSVILDNINILSENFDKLPTHLKIGDKCILNIYSLKFSGENGWDGGTRSMLHNIKEITEPITVKITDIVVDKSLALEKLQFFLDNHTDEFLFYNVKIENAWVFYLKQNKVNYFKNPDKEIELVGLYKTAFFTCEKFQPKWGLNTHTFHVEGTPEYDTTFKVWAREIEISNKRKELSLMIDSLEKEKKEIDKNYKNITYATTT